MKDEVNEYLDSLSELIIIDESSNINKARIANISVNTTIDSIHWLSEDFGSMQSTSVNMAIWLEGHLHTLTHGNLERVNSCAIDTMLSMREHLCSKSNLQHFFLIPCDSHLIQHLIRDLNTSIPLFNKVHDNAQMIAKSFKNSPLQYARLRDIQYQEYGRTWAIILAVAMSWRSEKGFLDGLFRSNAAKQPFNVMQYVSRMCQMMSLTLFYYQTSGQILRDCELFSSLSMML